MGASSSPSVSAARALLVAVALLACAAGAAAQDESTTGAARALFEEGLRLVDGGHWDDARDRFERALSLRRSPVIAFNLATADAHVGRLLEAMELFEEVRRDGASPAEARTVAARELASLRPRIGRLIVRIAGPRDDVTLRLDGHLLPSALVGVSAPANPGPHTADAERHGRSIARATATVLGAATAELRLTVPAPPRAARTPGHIATAGSDDHIWVWVGVMVGVGVVAIVAVMIAFVLSQQPPEWSGDTSPGMLRW